MSSVESLRQSATRNIGEAASLSSLEELRVSLLGKKGQVTELLKTLGSLPVEEKKSFGAAVNQLKEEITAALDARKTELTRAALAEQLKTETVDLTLPCRPVPDGRIHPLSQVTEEIIRIFAGMGFSVAEGPDIEDDYHNFTALNIAENHPARQMHDTFYLRGQESGGGIQGKETLRSPTPEARPLLRTHTSPVQIRVMQSGKPPFRVIAPGATYRCDSDQTHTPMFHQVEGFLIDKGIHMGHLKGCLTEFLQRFFGMESVPVRFRPSYFPFTEPSSEVDIGCRRTKDELIIGAPSLTSPPQAGGAKENTPPASGGGKGGDWLEVLGCGMVHPNVLKNCGLDPNEWQGFAFGMGIERLAMLKYGIPDLRTFFDPDVRWLKHYGFKPLDIPDLAGGA